MIATLEQDPGKRETGFPKGLRQNRKRYRSFPGINHLTRREPPPQAQAGPALPGATISQPPAFSPPRALAMLPQPGVMPAMAHSRPPAMPVCAAQPDRVRAS